MINKHDFLFLLHNLDKEAGYDDYYSYYGGSDNEYEDEKLTPNEDWSILNCAKRQRVHQVRIGKRMCECSIPVSYIKR